MCVKASSAVVRCRAQCEHHFRLLYLLTYYNDQLVRAISVSYMRHTFCGIFWGSKLPGLYRCYMYGGLKRLFYWSTQCMVGLSRNWLRECPAGGVYYRRKRTRYRIHRNAINSPGQLAQTNHTLIRQVTNRHLQHIANSNRSKQAQFC